MLATQFMSMALKSSADGNGFSGPSTQVATAYTLFFGLMLMMYHFVANGEFSSILTMAVMFQCLACALLTISVVTKGNVSGISARALQMEALSFGFRLSSTTWLNGYLPVDASGDFLFQAVDVCSLLLVLFMLYKIHVTDKSSYQEEQDSMPTLPMVLVCFVLAALLHADMNSRPLFDTLWMAGLFIGVVSVLPQLWLNHQTGGVIDSCMSHYIAMLAVSRILSGTFMWHARESISSEDWIMEDFNHASWSILGAHALHLVFLADFGYHYVKAVAQKGLNCQIEMHDAGCFV